MKFAEQLMKRTENALYAQKEKDKQTIEAYKNAIIRDMNDLASDGMETIDFREVYLNPNTDHTGFNSVFNMLNIGGSPLLEPITQWLKDEGFALIYDEQGKLCAASWGNDTKKNEHTDFVGGIIPVTIRGQKYNIYWRTAEDFHTDTLDDWDKTNIKDEISQGISEGRFDTQYYSEHKEQKKFNIEWKLCIVIDAEVNPETFKNQMKDISLDDISFD